MTNSHLSSKHNDIMTLISKCKRVIKALIDKCSLKLRATTIAPTLNNNLQANIHIFGCIFGGVE